MNNMRYVKRGRVRREEVECKSLSILPLNCAPGMSLVGVEVVVAAPWSVSLKNVLVSHVCS